MNTLLKPIKIKDKVISIPVFQGGMGIGVSLGKLATAVINEGGVGTISAAQTGFDDETFWDNYKSSCQANYDKLKAEIEHVREHTSEKGFLAVNILCASRDYANLAKTAAQNGVDAIVSGAGLPLDLPKYTMGTKTANIPIVSSSRVLNLIMRKWQRKYDVIPDAVVIEGPMAGGHLGVKYEEINQQKVTTLEERLVDVKNFMKKNDYNFPVIVAGGIFTNDDIKKMLELGADGVQLGTRFIATNECDASMAFKEKFIEAKQEDIVYVKSPVGYPARAIQNNFTKRLSAGNLMPKKCIACVLPCKGKVETTPYCISERLSRAVKGDTENGLVFTGANGYRIEQITSVKNLFNELIGEKNE